MAERTLFVPRLMDATQLNAQNNNARQLLKRWELGASHVTTLTYHEPDPQIASNPRIKVVRLWRRHAWPLHLFLRYLRPYDAIFYPGAHAADMTALRWRRRLGLKCPIIATLEGLVGDENREAFYSVEAGHQVNCQRVQPSVLARIDEILESTDHIIAISPFLARMGRLRYGDKFSVLPLGIDYSIYHSVSPPRENARPVVVTAGRVYSGKRPDLFFALARRFPDFCFRWFGGGELLDKMLQEVKAQKLENLEFAGPKQPHVLAEEFRKADIFILPSIAEGVPKVSQEAAACGLPVIIFGFYEAPSVVDGENGYVVWSDEEMATRLEQLLSDKELRTRLGARGAVMSREWKWDIVALKWERKVLSVIENVR